MRYYMKTYEGLKFDDAYRYDVEILTSKEYLMYVHYTYYLGDGHEIGESVFLPKENKNEKE